MSTDEVEDIFGESDNEWRLKYRRELQSAIRSSSSSHSFSPIKNGEKEDLHCIIFVNGLAEFANLNPKTLSERSHFQLLVDICERNKGHNIPTTLVDIRHPGRCALFAGIEAMDNHEIKAFLPFNWNISEEEILQAYKAAAIRLAGQSDGTGLLNFKVISALRKESLKAFLEHCHKKIKELFNTVGKSAYSIHAGGIIAPYLLEAVLDQIGGNHYFYQFSYLNTSFSLRSYKALLSPRPDLPVASPSRSILRPGNIRLSDDFEFADQICINKINKCSGKNIVLSIGRGVVNQLNPNYISYLSRLKSLISDLTYAYFSDEDKMSDRMVAVEKLGIETIGIGYAPNLFQCLRKMRNLNIVVLNPRHFGNGGCLLQAAQAEIPVIVCEGNDSGNFHPSNHIVKTEVDAVLLSYDLFKSKSFRSKWISDSLEHIRSEATRCAISMDTIISDQKSTRNPEKIFLVGNNKTGSTSLGEFLKIIGYTVAPQRPAVRMYIKHLKRKTDIWQDLSLFISQYEGFRDLPFSDQKTLEKLVEYYPNARFIYSIRDARAWYNSLLRHHASLFGFEIFNDGEAWAPSNRQEMIESLKESKLDKDDDLTIAEIHLLHFDLRNEDELLDRKIYMGRHLDHERNALNLLRGKKRLIIDFTRDTRIELKICDFLEMEQPSNLAFPHLNKSAGRIPQRKA